MLSLKLKVIIIYKDLTLMSYSTASQYMYISKLAKFMISILLMLHTNPISALATTDSSLSVDSKYTEQGFVWYSQSGNQYDGMQGYWYGFNKSYYGRVTMFRPAYSACGPISLAIILTNVKQQEITPKETIQWSCDTGTYTGNGSSHTIGVKGAVKYGVSYDECDNKPQYDRIKDMNTEVNWMRSHLEKGHWIQILVKNQPNVANTIWPYAGGHYVAIRGYKDGNTYVYDSVGTSKIEVPYSLEEVWKNIRNPYSDGCGSLHMTAIW